MVDESIVADVHNSYGRCLLGDRFLNRFYDIFFASDDEIPRRFATIDLDKQKELLRHGLGTVLNYAKKDNDMATFAIARLKDSHGPDKLNIEPALFELWKQSLVKAVSECDPEYTPELGEKWKMVVQPAIEEMTSAFSNQSVVSGSV